MDPEERLRKAIGDIAERRNNVTIDEILAVINTLGPNLTVKVRQTKHGVLVRIQDQIFHLCTHHRGSKQLKTCYVDEFLDAMAELGLFED
jgi:hypothetical protein